MIGVSAALGERILIFAPQTVEGRQVAADGQIAHSELLGNLRDGERGGAGELVADRLKSRSPGKALVLECQAHENQFVTFCLRLDLAARDTTWRLSPLVPWLRFPQG